MNIYDCIYYKPSFLDLFFPNIAVLYKLCLSEDKTKLFLISLTRIIIYLTLFLYLRSYEIIELNLNNIPKTMFYSFIVSYIIMNIFYIIIVLFKEVAINKYELDETSTKLALALKQQVSVVKPTVLGETPTKFV